MVSREKRGTVNIGVFGFLRRHMDDQGLSYALERQIASKGEPAFDIARMLSLPPEEIEAVFRNGRVINIYDPVFPGDRVAFFPFGTPGPYRVFLGMARENVERARHEKKAKAGEKRL
jgi:hypothetical protein